MSESRQQRRARERAQFDRVHGQVLAAKTVRHMWLTYARTRLQSAGVDINSPDVRETVEHAFYAGVAAMFELMQRVAPDDVSEDRGVEMLARLQEELETYTRGLS